MKVVTLNHLLERLKQLDEVTLVELLELTSEDIVDKFTDLIEDNKEVLASELEDFFIDEGGNYSE